VAAVVVPDAPLQMFDEIFFSMVWHRCGTSDGFASPFRDYSLAAWSLSVGRSSETTGRKKKHGGYGVELPQVAEEKARESTSQFVNGG